MKQLCRHCQRRRAYKPRALCWACYYAPGVRELYPVVPCRGNRRARPDRYGRAPDPDEPTDALPGSADKIAILAHRASLGQSLFHRQDATYETAPEPLQSGRQANSKGTELEQEESDGQDCDG